MNLIMALDSMLYMRLEESTRHTLALRGCATAAVRDG
jgi:hypothetical protein